MVIMCRVCLGVICLVGVRILLDCLKWFIVIYINSSGFVGVMGRLE